MLRHVVAGWGTWVVGHHKLFRFLPFSVEHCWAFSLEELVYGEDDQQRAEPDVVNDLFQAVRDSYFRLYFNFMYFDVAKQLDLKTSWDILRPPETQAWETAALNWTVSHGVFAERVAHELNLQHIWKTCPVVIRNSKPVQFFCKNNQVWRRVTPTEVFLLAIWRCFALHHPGAVHLQRWDHAGVFATTCWRFQQCGAILSISGPELGTDACRHCRNRFFPLSDADSIWHHVWCFAAKDSRSPLSRSAKFNWDQRSGQSIQCTWKKLEIQSFLWRLPPESRGLWSFTSEVYKRLRQFSKSLAEAGPKFALDSSDSSVWIYRMHCKKMQNTFWVAYVEVHCNVSREGIHGKPRDSGYRKGETGACDSLHFAATMWLAWVKHWDSLSRTRLQHMFACNVSLLSVWTLAFKDVETGSTESKSPGCMKASPVKRRGCPMAAWCSYIL